MITQIIKLLQTNEFNGVSYNVEIAKGRNKFITTFGQLKYQMKRWLKR
jgi:hypothetical protein